jgi:hypothetical protein
MAAFLFGTAMHALCAMPRRVVKVGADETTALQGGRANYALMKPLRYKAVKRTTLSSPLRILAVADGGTVRGAM